jgi:tetratricopeptide (TPR) repeat protein
MRAIRRRTPRSRRASWLTLARRASWLTLALSVFVHPARADELDEQRAHFEQGMTAFRDGRVAEALGLWEPILAQIGDDRGFRLLYNLGVAHEQLNDATRAADRFERFLVQVRTRPREGLPAEVVEFERDATARLAALQGRFGRVRVTSERGEALLVRMDRGAPQLAGQTVYLVPGRHQITVRPGASDEQTREVELVRGQLVELRIPAPAAPPSSVGPLASSAPPALPAPSAPPPARPPFSPVWIGVTAALAAGSVALPLYFRADALDLKRVYDTSPSLGQRQSAATDYGAARTRYELSWALPGALGVGSGVLAALYLLTGSRAGTPQVGVLPGAVTLSGRF